LSRHLCFFFFFFSGAASAATEPSTGWSAFFDLVLVLVFEPAGFFAFVVSSAFMDVDSTMPSVAAESTVSTGVASCDGDESAGSATAAAADAS
jgi:hypothetical protein